MLSDYTEICYVGVWSTAVASLLNF